MKIVEHPTVRKRRRTQWLLLWLVVITIGLGWRYTLLGYVVPVVMLAGMIGAVVRGRYVCGNLCPRGGFLDRIMPSISINDRIPDFFRNSALRWSVFALLMGFMLYRGLQKPADIYHWGHVFWTMCAVTTAVALALAVLVHPRTWCAFCPMGTMQAFLGGSKGQLIINAEKCKGCRLCEKSCSFGLPIADSKKIGYLPVRDCLKCSECIGVCPTKALSWPEAKETRKAA